MASQKVSERTRQHQQGLYDSTRQNQLNDLTAAQEKERIARLQEVFNLSKAICYEMERILTRTWKLVLIVYESKGQSRGAVIMDAKDICLGRLIQIMPPRWPISDALNFYENAGLIAFHHNAALALPDLTELIGPAVLSLTALEEQYKREPDPIMKEKLMSQAERCIRLGIAVGFASDKRSIEGEMMEDQYNKVMNYLATLAGELRDEMPSKLAPISASDCKERRRIAKVVMGLSTDEQVERIIQSSRAGARVRFKDGKAYSEGPALTLSKPRKAFNLRGQRGLSASAFDAACAAENIAGVFDEEAPGSYVGNLEYLGAGDAAASFDRVIKWLKDQGYEVSE